MRGDPGVAEAAAAAGATVVIMHNQRNRPFHDVAADIREGLLAGCAVAERAGIPRERLILDPGFGFGWRPEQSIEMLRRLGELRDLGRPLLVGTSRKSAIGAVLGLPVGERLLGTAASVAMAIANGADIVRVHDVREMAQVARMTDAVVRGWAAPHRSSSWGVGGNLGDRLAHLRRGVALLAPEVSVTAASALYESAPGASPTSRRSSTPPCASRRGSPPTTCSPSARRWRPRPDARPAVAGARAPSTSTSCSTAICASTTRRSPSPTPASPSAASCCGRWPISPPRSCRPAGGAAVAAALAEIGEEGLRRVAGPEWAPGPGPTPA